MCLSSDLIVFDRCERKNSYLFFLAKTLDQMAHIDQMGFCFSCKTTAVKTSDNFCSNCGSKQPSDEERCIICYFHQAFSHVTIVKFLAAYHNLEISLRALKKRLRKLGLTRRNNTNPDAIREMVTILSQETKGPVGYRYLWHQLKFQGINVPRELVIIYKRMVDPAGVERRKRHVLKRRIPSSLGPNDYWHVDGYDKLKPFNFAIQGCTDGHSRKVLWFKVGKSNSNPKIIASYFMELVTSLKASPRKVRTDCGTESVLLAAMQYFLRRNHSDELSGLRAHSYGNSQQNQRLEASWSHLRRSKTTWMIIYFKEMMDNNLYDPSSDYQVACAQFRFMKLIQKDLDLARMH